VRPDESDDVVEFLGQGFDEALDNVVAILRQAECKQASIDGVVDGGNVLAGCCLDELLQDAARQGMVDDSEDVADEKVEEVIMLCGSDDFA
jgi:hypothetical protein